MMPGKYDALPQWVVPLLHWLGTGLGFVLVAVVAFLAFRAGRRGVGGLVVALLLVSLPCLLEGLHLAAFPALAAAGSVAVTAYEIAGAVLAVWLGTIWYRRNLGGPF